MLSIAILMPWLAASVVPDEPKHLHPPISISEGLDPVEPRSGWPIAWAFPAPLSPPRSASRCAHACWPRSKARWRVTGWRAWPCGQDIS